MSPEVSMYKNLPPVLPLQNPVRHYAWGSYDGLSRYAGVEQDKDRPSAELWMGAHPDDPSKLLLPDGGRLPLDKYVAEQPIQALGEEVFAEFGGLPFLFKVLSASMPLSIQVHPDKARAEAGYSREDARGIGLSQPERDYRDRNHKPELALALSDFSALCGFREAGRIEELVGPELGSFFGYSASGGEVALKALIAASLRLKEKDRLSLERLASTRAKALAASSDAEARLAGETVLSCYAHYPHDPGALSPLFLEVLSLRPGQAIYVPAGVMHAYLSGTILEIMASSDNVIRGGLTQKHIDVDELVNILDCSASPDLIGPTPTESGSVWPSPAREFSLSLLEPPPSGKLVLTTNGPEILLCVEGSVGVETGSTAPLTLSRGSSAFVSAACRSYSLVGSAKVYRAQVGGSEAGPR